MNTVHKFMMPSTSIIGPGAITEAGAEIKALGYKKALVVTDKILNQLGVVAKVTDVLDANNIAYATYDAVEPNPTMKSVHDGFDMLKAEECDFIISLGGGYSLGRGNQNVSQTVFSFYLTLMFFIIEKITDFPLRDGDPVVHLTLAQARS